MRTRLLIVATAGLSLGAAAAAEPAKAPVRKADRPVEQPARVVVASADEVRVQPPSEETAAVPAKRERKARVTSCRCGDQTASN